MAYLDTRDLIEERENLKQQILDNWNEKFNQEVDTFEEIDFTEETLDNYEVESFQDYWDKEYTEINAINTLEDEVGSEWEYGVTLISEDDFEEYCENFIDDCGYISKDTPGLIRNNIDWSGIADDMKQYYTEVEFRGTIYLTN